MTVGFSDQIAALHVRKVYDPATNNNEPIQCPECARIGLTQFLRFHHISLHEAVQKCARSTCMYPFRGFRYRSTNDPQQRVYRLERIVPPNPSSASTTCGSPTETKVDDDATTAAPAVLELNDHQDDAVYAGGGNVLQSAQASVVPDLSVLVNSAGVDGDDDPFNMLWLDEIAAQASDGEGGQRSATEQQQRREDMHGVSQLFEDFSLDEGGMEKCLDLGNDSIMDQLDIDEILDDICNSGDRTDEFVDSDALERTLHELSSAIINPNKVEPCFEEVPVLSPPPPSERYVPFNESTTPSPQTSSGPPRLTKCFAQFAPPKRRKPARKSRKSDKAALNCILSSYPKFEQQSDEDSIAASSSTRSTSPTDSITSTSSSNASTREKRASDAAERLQHIIALKNKLAPLDLITSLVTLDVSAVNRAPSSNPVRTNTKTVRRSRKCVDPETSRCRSMFKLNFVTDREETAAAAATLAQRVSEPAANTIISPPSLPAAQVFSTNSIDGDPDFFGFVENPKAEKVAAKKPQPDFLGFTRREIKFGGRRKMRILHQLLIDWNGDKQPKCTIKR